MVRRDKNIPWEVIIRKFKCEISEKEQAELDVWLADVENHARFQAMTISCKQEEWLIVKKSKSWTRNGYSALFCQTANLIRTISHFTGDKLGNIIRFHQAGIVVRLLLREQKRFTCFAILPDIRNERTRVQSIQTPAAEHNPSSVGRPRMVTFRIIAVERFRIRAPCECRWVWFIYSTG